MIYPCIKAYIAHTNIQINEQKVLSCLNIFATSESICEVFFKYSKKFLHLGTGEKGEEGRLRVKGERLEVKGMPCKGLKNSAQGNALGGKENEDEYEYENENCLADGNYKLYTLNTKQENINTNENLNG